MNETYNIVAEQPQSTVIARYEKPQIVAESYQSESELEQEFISRLGRQGYEHLPIHSEAELVANLRRQLERLNKYEFTDGEWERFYKQELSGEGKGIVDKTRTIQQDFRKSLILDDGTQRNILVIDHDDPHANYTQVINQYVPTGGARENRYDVTVLVNGLPMVHIELKRRGVSIKQAFNQINRYGRESFWAGCGLFEYVQLFVISNGTQTKYYSNTTRDGHLRELSASKKQRAKQQTSHSFEFTSYWADQQNQVINDLDDFTATFFSRHTLLNILTRYCILTEQNLLLVMRPYQIAATERLLNQVEKAHNGRFYGKREAGGYIWHTTGSGKTLTSFKAAQIATELDYISKVIFVVDRKDLDYQTMKEYDRFQKGAANGNTSTAILEKQLRGKERIVITTIQKLATLIKKYPTHDIYNQEVVIIFDECHRSQFGDMHAAIVKKFKKYYIFGFTGTPIFTENMLPGKGLQRTTEDVFGKRLHTYTIVDAIRDHNVLPFRVSYVRTVDEKSEGVADEKVWSINQEKVFMAPQRIANVSAYILEHFDQQTMRSQSYHFSRLQNIADVVKSKPGKEVAEIRVKERLNGFNSILAVQSIDAAKLYYDELRRQMEALPENRKLKIATIFSFGVNDDEEENSDSTDGLAECDRDFLERAIADYNAMFGTNYDTSADKFPNYYKDISQRMKNREIDLLIVVNMFLTGFDATTLNTLWVDKRLRYHGLLQGYSRTNRILNSVKTWGNIVCFRNLEDATNKALSLFGDSDAHSTAILRAFEDYFLGYDDDGKHVKGYSEFVDELLRNFKQGELPHGEQKEKEFIRLFGTILKFVNLLSCFDEFKERNPLSERMMQDYLSIYIDLHEKYSNREKHDSTDITDDVEFEMELVKQVEVNIDYILYLVSLYHESHCQDAEIRVKIAKSIDSSPDLRDKKELIERFIDSLNATDNVDAAWREYVNEQKRKDFDALIAEERLKRDKALRFISSAWERGYVPEGGTEVYDILPPVNPFDRKANRQGIFQKVLDRLKAFFTQYYEVANGDFETIGEQ